MTTNLASFIVDLSSMKCMFLLFKRMVKHTLLLEEGQHTADTVGLMASHRHEAKTCLTTQEVTATQINSVGVQ